MSYALLPDILGTFIFIVLALYLYSYSSLYKLTEVVAQNKLLKSNPNAHYDFTVGNHQEVEASQLGYREIFTLMLRPNLAQ